MKLSLNASGSGLFGIRDNFYFESFSFKIFSKFRSKIISSPAKIDLMAAQKDYVFRFFFFKILVERVKSWVDYLKMNQYFFYKTNSIALKPT